MDASSFIMYQNQGNTILILGSATFMYVSYFSIHQEDKIYDKMFSAWVFSTSSKDARDLTKSMCDPVCLHLTGMCCSSWLLPFAVQSHRTRQHLQPGHHADHWWSCGHVWYHICKIQLARQKSKCAITFTEWETQSFISNLKCLSIEKPVTIFLTIYKLLWITNLKKYDAYIVLPEDRDGLLLL